MIVAFVLGLITYPVVGMLIWVYFTRQDPSQPEGNLQAAMLWIMLPLYLVKFLFRGRPNE